jgi:Predicted membrane protein (DUF2142)
VPPTSPQWSRRHRNNRDAPASLTHREDIVTVSVSDIDDQTHEQAAPFGRRERWIATAISLLTQPRKVFAVAFALVFLNMAAWSLATPLFAAPDESTHVVRAAAVVHGQITGTSVRGSPITSVTVPELIADGVPEPLCFLFRTGVPASCARPLATSTKPVVTTTSVGHYPPLYYAVVGLPLRVTVSTTGIYLMRLVNAAICASFIGLAFVCITTWSRRWFLLAGVLLALTPMVVFLGGVVNPNGPEVCEAICAWTAGLILVLERADDPPRALVVILTVSLAILAFARGLSPLWVALILLVLGFMAGRRRAMQLLRVRSLKISLAIIAACGIAAVAWIVAEHSNSIAFGGPMLPAHEGTLDTVFSIFGYSGTWIQQMIGVFGYLDTPAPFVTFLVWYVAIGLIVLLALSCSASRGAIALLGLVTLVVFVPVFISYPEVHRFGLAWQGRYTLPLAVGIPILSATLIDATNAIARFRIRISVIFCICIGVGDFAAFFTAQRRYASGLPGPIDPAQGTWAPPLGNYLMTIWSLAATALLVGAVAFAISQSQTAENTLSEGTPLPEEREPQPLDAFHAGG